MIYDEHGALIDSPDLTAGYLYPHHKADGSVVYIYHAWTADELAEMDAAQSSQPSAEELLSAMMEGIADA